MEDNQIINLYFDRSEQAIKETDTKYGGYCYSIAYNILTNQEDAEESVSDTYLSAWNSMPPSYKRTLSATCPSFFRPATHRHKLPPLFGGSIKTQTTMVLTTKLKFWGLTTWQHKL